MPLTMTEPGWPLIPREVLPAPVPAAARGPASTVRVRRADDASRDAGRQLSVFGVEAADPSPADLAGLLAGPGRLDRMGGTARVSVQVDAAWRVHVLAAELVARGLVVSWSPVPLIEGRPDGPHADPGPAADGDSGPDAAGARGPGADDAAGGDDPAESRAARGRAANEVLGPGADEAAGTGAGEAPGTGTDAPARPGGVVGFEVRTAYSSRLNDLARAWPPPSGGLFLGGARLRLWVAAAGAPGRDGFVLGLGGAGPIRDTVEAALSRAGLAPVLSDDGLSIVITGRKRLSRLAELVGDRPAAAPVALWPGGATS
ncbi:hypothetical protein KRMM14A1259_50890 [Krasilnikovia sp. MM14-A1259]